MLLKTMNSHVVNKNTILIKILISLIKITSKCFLCLNDDDIIICRKFQKITTLLAILNISTKLIISFLGSGLRKGG